MAELSTLARPYAKAAFQFASENQCVSQWGEMLKLVAAVSEQKNVAALLSSPATTAEHQVKTLTDVCGDDVVGGDIGQHGVNFLRILAGNRRLPLLPQICSQFQVLQAEQLKVVEVDLISAFDIGASQQQALAGKLRQTLNRDVNINTTIDRALIGGVYIRAGDLVIDGSVRGKLAKLAEVLNQ